MTGRNNKSEKNLKTFPNVRADGQTLPSFDEQALSALTDKIEKDLGKASGKALNSTASIRGTQRVPKISTSAESKSQRKTKGHDRGWKRDARGNEKTVSQRSAKDHGRLRNNQAGEDVDERKVLLREILALGGTEEDLDLVGDAASHDEEEDIRDDNALPSDKSFREDLAKFVADLGIDGKVGRDASESEDEEYVKDTWEDASDFTHHNASGDTSQLEYTRKTPAAHDLKMSNISLKDQNRLIFEARPDWHALSLPSLPIPKINNSELYRYAVMNLKTYATALLEADNNLYASKHLSSSSSHRFLSTIMSSGTLSDKVSALTLVIQESPVHTTKSFDSLLTLAKKRSRGQAVTALGALKDLLGVGVVLPANRRLRSFAAQPGLLGALQEGPVSNWNLGDRLPGKITKVHLISWAYEDRLKESYFEMLKVLEGWCNDEVAYARSRAVTYVYELLKEKPEQESNLLKLLVNKLGDPDKKIASRTSYLLLQLQTSHPLMKPIIIHSIESELLLRPGQSSHAMYCAINTLNQTILTSKEEDVARKLLNIYFDLFVFLLRIPGPQKGVQAPLVNRKGQIQGGGGQEGKKAKAKATKEEEMKQANDETVEKMISAVLTGVNRAFPFSKTDDTAMEQHMDTLFRITHSSNFNTSVQALMLIEQLATAKHISVDRFYRTLYESLLDPRLLTTSKRVLYLNLLFRSLRSDLNVKRVKAFAKRMLQVVTLHEPPFICGILYMLSELEATFPGLKSLLHDPEEYNRMDEEVFRDVPEDFTTAMPVHPDRISSSKITSETYDGRRRDPEHSNADKSCLWECIPFLAHFHPSVSMFALCLLSDEKMPPKPDLDSHTLAHFLDKFVYRNAKAAAGGPRGSSIMQPLAGGDSKGVLLSSRATQGGRVTVNSEAFWRKKAEDVAVEDVFFHRYFSQVGKTRQAARKKDISLGFKEDSDNAEDGGENEDEIWQDLVDSRQEDEDKSDDGSDLEILELDDSDAESSLSGIVVDPNDPEDAGSDDSVGPELNIFEDDDALLSSGDDSASEVNDELFARELQTEQKSELERSGQETSRHKRRKLKNLPTFASVEDYAEMLEVDDDIV